MGDMEMWELIEPFLYIGQRVKPNTAGPGRHRGGSGYETLRLAWKTPFYEMQNIGDGRVRWLETQAPQPPRNHSYRFNRDWDYLEQVLGAR